MLVKHMGLPWIAVADLERARRLYVDVLGFTVVEENKHSGWLELEVDGAVFGVCQIKDAAAEQAVGQNAVLTFVVDDIEQARAEMERKQVTFIGDIVEAADAFKMTTFIDADGNTFQLFQPLNKD